MNLDCDHYLIENKLQASTCERDLGVDTMPSLSLENYIRRIIKEVNYIPLSVKMPSVHVQGFQKKIYATWIQISVCNTSLVIREVWHIYESPTEGKKFCP